MEGRKLEVVEEERDVGVVVHRSLKPSRQCERAANTAIAVLNQIKRNFHFRDRHVYLKLYKQYVRPHVKFATPAWSPWLQKDIKCLEKVQEKAVAMVVGLKEREYTERCKELGLDTLEERRRKLDLTQAFKIIRGIDNIDAAPLFRIGGSTVRTRQAEDPIHITKDRNNLEIRGNFFTQRIVTD